MTKAICLAITLLYTITGCRARAANYLHGLSDPNVKVRESAWESVAMKRRELNTDQIIPVLPEGLRDSDPQVRHNAVAIVGERGAESRIKLKKFLFSDHPEITKPLLGLLKDDDPDVRESAIAAVVYALEPSKELEKTLLDDYELEKNPSRRAQLVGALLLISGKQGVSFHKHEPTQRVVDLFMAAIDDQSDQVRGAAAQAISQMKNPPADVLPKLANKLDISDWYSTQFYLAAIARYGPAAKPYLSKLEQMQKYVENLDDQHGGKTLRWNVDNAIRKIKGDSEKAKTQTGDGERATK